LLGPRGHVGYCHHFVSVVILVKCCHLHLSWMIFSQLFNWFQLFSCKKKFRKLQDTLWLTWLIPLHPMGDIGQPQFLSTSSCLGLSSLPLPMMYLWHAALR
jgi:hypothetical protein